MSYDEIKKYIYENNGIYFTKKLKEEGIDKYYINKLLNDGIIERYEPGVYLRNDIFEDGLYILQQKYPSIIYSYNTALYLHHLTERTPDRYDVTVYSGYNTNHLPSNLNFHFIKKENHHLGEITLKTNYGYDVRTYDLERITCDITSSKNTNIEKEQVNKYLRKVFLENKLDSIKLIDYAKKLGCEKKVRKVIDILIW